MTYNPDQFELIPGIVLPPPVMRQIEDGVLFRAISSATDIRTIIALPWHHTFPWLPADSMTLILCDTARDAAVLSAVMNSIVYDYLARNAVGGANVNNFHVAQLPIPPPEDFEVRHTARQTVADYLIERVVALTYSDRRCQAWAHALIPGAPLQTWQPPEVRLRLRAEIDAAIAKVYGVAKDDLAHIFGTFPIWEKQDSQQYGSFKSRDTTLALMD